MVYFVKVHFSSFLKNHKKEVLKVFMNYKFSERFLKLKPSAIREIFKYAADPEVVSLSAGNPAPDAFPIDEIKSICADIFENSPVEALQYNITEGYAPLRTYLKQHLKDNHGAGMDFDDVLITSGAQQVMELSAKVLCDDGDVIICENPSFIGSLNSFRGVGARLAGVDMESDGISVKGLEKALKENKNTKFIYTIPNFQNPTGITASYEKRKAMYNLACEYDVLIVEDDPYGELRFKGENVPSIKSLDTEGRVIYSGSFSKVISPGLRVGYTLAPTEIIKKQVVAKQGEDVHTNILAQMICYKFLSEFDFQAHLLRLREIYRRKALLAQQLLDEYLVPKGITYYPIEGGLFLWCVLPDGIDMPEFCKKAVMDYKVAVVPGTAFLPVETAFSDCFRINFSTPSDEALKLGVERLSQMMDKY